MPYVLIVSFTKSVLRVQMLLAPSDVNDSRSTLSSGLYIVRANTTNLADERHYVIYWPEETTWNDSATSSVRRNRVTFMRCVTANHPFLLGFSHFNRYLTKMCDQVVALLSSEHSASLVWKDEDADVKTGNSDRLFTFEVAETNEQEENAVTRPGFQVTSHLHHANVAFLIHQR